MEELEGRIYCATFVRPASQPWGEGLRDFDAIAKCRLDSKESWFPGETKAMLYLLRWCDLERVRDANPVGK